jgi:transcription elongation factor GreB
MQPQLITREGFEALQAELKYLWKTERPETTRLVTWAASLGDRSENADYQYNKKKLREIDRRVRYLRKTLENCQIVDYNPQQEGAVYFGAWIELEDDTGQILKVRIVGTEEIYRAKDYISINSPMAKACIGKKLDDEVLVQTPTGLQTWYVTDICYQSRA